MSSLTRQYLFGAIFIAVGMYHIYLNDLLEFGLYASAGLSFIFNSLTLEPKFGAYKKPLVFVTWIFILMTGILFFYLLRTKF